MQSNEQKLREALQAYQDANEMSPYGDYSKIEWESSAGPVNPSWGGGDCKKHGRWYGRCYSCSDEWDNLRKRADRDAYTARENALNAAKQIARQVLALPTAVPESLEALSRKLDTQTPDLEVSEMINGLTQSETDASASVSGLTAAPVGEREEFEKELARLFGYSPHAFGKDRNGDYAERHIDEFYMVWQARAALSAGDVVDAGKFHKLFEAMDEGRASIIVEGATRSIDGGEIFTDIDDALDAIDSAMRARGEAV